MDTTFRSRIGNSFFGLIDRVKEEIHNFIQHEIELAKTEMSEKLAHFSRNGVYIAIGAMTAYAALILLLLSLCFLAASGFEKLGLSTGISLFLGFLSLAIVVGGAGAFLVVKAIAALKKASLAPQKTMQTLAEIKAPAPGAVPIRAHAPAPDATPSEKSEALVSQVRRSHHRIRHDLSKLRERLSLSHLTKDLVAHVKSHPLRSVGIGLGTGVAGWIMVRGARLFGRKGEA